MIKIFLKHFIYEMCIEQFFYGIEKNFKIPNLAIRVGDRFRILIIRKSKETYTVFNDVNIIGGTKNLLLIDFRDYNDCIQNKKSGAFEIFITEARTGLQTIEIDTIYEILK